MSEFFQELGQMSLVQTKLVSARQNVSLGRNDSKRRILAKTVSDLLHRALAQELDQHVSPPEMATSKMRRFFCMHLADQRVPVINRAGCHCQERRHIAAAILHSRDDGSRPLCANGFGERSICVNGNGDVESERSIPVLKEIGNFGPQLGIIGVDDDRRLQGRHLPASGNRLERLGGGIRVAVAIPAIPPKPLFGSG